MKNCQREEEVRRFADREIYSCQSMLVDELLNKELFSYDEIENLYRPFDGKLLSPSACYSCQLEFDALDSETGKCQDCYQDCQEAQEIFEWWLVSEWFAGKLKDKGEPILANGYGTWWGRTCTGQAISMDWVINQIYDEVMNY